MSWSLGNKCYLIVAGDFDQPTWREAVIVEEQFEDDKDQLLLAVRCSAGEVEKHPDASNFLVESTHMLLVISRKRQLSKERGNRAALMLQDSPSRILRAFFKMDDEGTDVPITASDLEVDKDAKIKALEKELKQR